MMDNGQLVIAQTIQKKCLAHEGIVIWDECDLHLM